MGLQLSDPPRCLGRSKSLAGLRVEPIQGQGAKLDKRLEAEHVVSYSAFLPGDSAGAKVRVLSAFTLELFAIP
jgi:hypothetical protein